MKQKILHLIHDILAFCARRYLQKHKPKTIGITGSVGKTSCRMVVTGVLQQIFPEKTIYTSPKNFNSELGLVFSIFWIEEYTPTTFGLISVLGIIILKTFISSKKYDIIVLEYGIDHPWDMQHLVSIVQPDYSIFTKLDVVHGEYFESKDAIWDEKFHLMLSTKNRTYLNYSDEYARTHSENMPCQIRWYDGQWIEVSNYDIGIENQAIQAKFQYKDHEFQTNLIGRENAYYIAIGLDIATHLDMSIALKDMSISLEVQPGRQALFEGIGESILLDSTYNASPASMKKMIETVKILQEKIFSDYKILCVLGDMRELGEYSKKEHESLIPYLEDVYRVFTVWPEMKKYLKIRNKQSYLSAKVVGQNLKDYLEYQTDKCIILFKWSQNTIYTEEVLKAVLKNPEDASKLVRQSDYWIGKKEEFFKELK